MRAAAWLLVLLLGGCVTFGGLEETPRVSLAGLESLSIQGLEQRYRVRLRLQNPNRHPLGVEGVSFRLFLNDRLFGDGVAPADLVIDPFSEALMTVDVTSNLYLLFRQVQQFSQREGRAVRWRIDGSLALDARPGRLAFRSEGELDLPRQGVP